MSHPVEKGAMSRKKQKQAKVTSLHPVSPLPTMLIRLHQLRRGTYATDFGLDAIFAPSGEKQPPHVNETQR